MPIYEYRCDECPGISYQTVTQILVPPTLECPNGHGTLKRRYSFSTPKMEMGGYDPALGRYFESETQRREFLKMKSDERTEATGIVHDYISVHPADLPETSGVPHEPTRSSTLVHRGQEREVIQWL